MKRMLLVAAALLLGANNVQAADGNVSKSALAKMGLSGVEVMSDEAGKEVRGKVAIRYGVSFARSSSAVPIVNFNTGPHFDANPVASFGASAAVHASVFPVRIAVGTGFSGAVSF